MLILYDIMKKTKKGRPYFRSMVKKYMYGLIEVIDYVKSCLFSKHGLYIAHKIDMEVSEIDGKRYPTFNVTPIPFKKGDVISGIPNGVVSDNSFCIQAPSTESYFWDDENNIVYMLYAKYYYDKDGDMNCSVIDEKMQEKKKTNIVLDCCCKMLLKVYPDGKGFNRGKIQWKFPSDINILNYIRD